MLVASCMATETRVNHSPPCQHVCLPLHVFGNSTPLQDMPSLCQEKAVIQAILHSMAQEGRAAQLRGFEHVSAVTLVPEPFTVENNLLTPTFKLKRPQAKAVYEALIDNMYERLSSGESSAGVGAGGAGSMAGKAT